jgi:hypothetical protein
MELENATAPIVLLVALQSEFSVLLWKWSPENWRYHRQNLGSEMSLMVCRGFAKAPRHGEFRVYMHATNDISYAEGDLYRATKSYGWGHGIWNTIYWLGRYTTFCGVLPLWSLMLDDLLQASISVQIQRHRYVRYRRHNSTEYTPKHNVQIPNYKEECRKRSRHRIRVPVLLSNWRTIYKSVNQHDKLIWYRKKTLDEITRQQGNNL